MDGQMDRKRKENVEGEAREREKGRTSAARHVCETTRRAQTRLHRKREPTAEDGRDNNFNNINNNTKTRKQKQKTVE
jgi:hypothetical protein